MLDSVNSIKDVFNPQENTHQARAIKEAEKPLKKIQDEIQISNGIISGLGQWRTHLENFESDISGFTYDFLRKNGVFDNKKIVTSKKLTENYANIKARPGTTNQQIPFEIQSIAKGEVLKSNEQLNPDEIFAKEVSNTLTPTKGAIILEVIDNGLKSASDATFASGKFTIGNSKEIEIKSGDTLQAIAKNINNVTTHAGEEKNPHVIASAEKDNSGKEYLWIRSDEKHHGIQNKFNISGDAVTNANFTDENQKIEVDFDDKITVNDFVAKLRNNAKKANIEVLYNPQLDSRSGKKTGTIALKSLLTGTGNVIKVGGSLTQSSFSIVKAQDAIIKVDGQEIISKTNKIEADNLLINLLHEPPKVQGKDQTFNLLVQNDTEGLVEKFEGLAKNYNELAKFVGTNSLQVEGEEIPKAAEIAALYSYRDQLNYINEHISNAFNKLNQFNRYGDDTSQFGITIKKTDYTPPPGKAENGKKQVYLPIEIYEMSIDKNKLQNALDENFDIFKDIVSYKFDSTDENFKLNDNHKDVDFERNNVKNLDYSIDYKEIEYFNNLSNPANSADKKINDSLSGKKSFILNDIKIDVDNNTNYSSLVDEINKYSSQTNIKAYLLGDDKITPTNNPTGSNFKIALSEANDKDVDATDLKRIQDNLRYSLTLADPEDALNGIFSNPAAKTSGKSLDIDTTHPLIGEKIPTIILYDTSKIVNVIANLEDNTEAELPSYFKLGNNNKLESGTVKILPKIIDPTSGKKLNLENFEIFYTSENNGSSTIFARQGIADKINNVINGYTKLNGSIDRFTRLEERDKTYKNSQLSSEKASFANKKHTIEKALNGLRIQEMNTKAYEEFLKQMNNAEKGRN
ncbi:MAG: flagellar filament capping protein FliD [Candidatus Midichloriaceae bacterium]